MADAPRDGLGAHRIGLLVSAPFPEDTELRAYLGQRLDEETGDVDLFDSEREDRAAQPDETYGVRFIAASES